MKKIIKNKLANARADLERTTEEIKSIQDYLRKYYSNKELYPIKLIREKEDRIYLLLNTKQQLIGAIDTYTDLLNCVENNNIINKAEKYDEIDKVWHKNEPMEAYCITAKHLQETYDDLLRFIKENEILKKGIKELLQCNIMNITIEEYIKTFDFREFNVEDFERYNKIKEMLEVLKNE